MLDKPYDFAVIVGIGAILVALMGMGLSDVQKKDPTIGSSDFFTDIGNTYESANQTGLIYTGTELSGSLSEGDSGEQTDDSFLVRAGKALLKLGGSFKSFSNAVSASGKAIPGFPVGLAAIFVSVLVIVFAVTIISWWRGKA